MGNGVFEPWLRGCNVMNKPLPYSLLEFLYVFANFFDEHDLNLHILQFTFT